MVTEPQMGEAPLQWIYSFTQWLKNMPHVHHFLVNKMNVETPDEEGEENGLFYSPCVRQLDEDLW